jgi:hypothetical protein
MKEIIFRNVAKVDLKFNGAQPTVAATSHHRRHPMCGIVGAVSTRNIVPILVQGLQRLEYRGYDSCGVAVYRQARRPAARAQHRPRGRAAGAGGKDQIEGGTGIAHTRWATHGAPAVHNAHPHFSHGPGADSASRPGRISLVHNGIIENHDELRAALQAGAMCSPARPTPRSSPPGGQPVRRRPVRGGEGRREATARRLCHCRVLQGRAAPRDRRARRIAADPGCG